MMRAHVTTAWPGGSVLASLAAASRWRAATHDEVQSFVPTDAGRLFITAFHPRAALRDTAFLLCHSYAWEQAELYALELLFARAAAAAGFPVLSFHARGYGDSGGAFEAVTLRSHVRDARAAGALLASWDGVRRVVPVGTRWGAAVALMAARELEADGAALWSPSLAPGRYLDGLLKVKSMAGMIDGGGEKLATLKDALLAGRTIDLIGYPLTPSCYADAQAADPLEGAAPANALVLTVNPGARRASERAAEELRARGCSVTVDEAEGEGRNGFGLGMPLSGHLATHRALFDDMARRTISWAERSW